MDIRIQVFKNKKIKINGYIRKKAKRVRGKNVNG